MFPYDNTVQIGSIFVERQLLSRDQVKRVLESQKKDPSQSFGQLAKILFGLNHEDIEDAWAEQSISSFREVDPLSLVIQKEALSLVGPRRDWQFGILPVSIKENILEVVTTKKHFRRASGLIEGVLNKEPSIALATVEALAEGLRRHLPFQNLGVDALKMTQKGLFDGR